MGSKTEQSRGQRALLHFLERQGRLSTEDAERVAGMCATEGLSVYEALERAEVISERDLAELLTVTLGLRPIDLTTYPLDSQVARKINETVAARYGVLPVRVDGQTIDVATANPLDLDALKAIEFATGKRVRALVATNVEIRDAMAHAYKLQESLEQFLQHVPDSESLTVSELRDDVGDLRTIVQDAELPPVVRLVDLMLVEGIKARASDVHVEPGPDGLIVRYRVDGVLEEAFRFPKWVQNPLTARLKIMAQLDITERRVPQDGRIQVRYRDRKVDLRVASLPARHGEKITLRILDATTSLQALDGIGLSAEHLPVLRDAIQQPQGMILITGPTGSGKTTTLYAVLRELFSPNINIVTIEDPIEYQLQGINQVEVDERQKRTFATVLRSVLRQDPDVILVGEIRDAETARIAFQAAQTGHLVLSTVHTNDAAGAVTRLIDLGLDPRAVALAVTVVIAQRLLRCVCATCAIDEPLDEETRRHLRLPDDFTSARRGAGCQACRQSGFSGRTGVYEVLRVTPAIERLLESGAGEAEIRRRARADGDASLLDDAVQKLRAGVTSVSEIGRVVQIKEEEEGEEATLAPVAEPASCMSCGKVIQVDWTACPFCAAPVSGAAAAAGTTSDTPRSFRALVVDDTEQIRELVRATIERSDLPLEVATAADGAEALALVAGERPDVVILDVSMPDMDGFEVCRRLRSEVRTAFVPVLMLSAHSDIDFVERGFGVGADDYMVKPFRRDDLIVRLRRMLERTYGKGPVCGSDVVPYTDSAAVEGEPIDRGSVDALAAQTASVVETCEALDARLAAGEHRLTELADAFERWTTDGQGPESGGTDRLALLAARLEELQAEGRDDTRLVAVEGAVEALRTDAEQARQAAAAETAQRLTGLAARLEELEGDRRTRIAEIQALRDREEHRVQEMRSLEKTSSERLRELAQRIEDDGARREALPLLVNGSEAQLAELAGRMRRESVRLDTLLKLVDGCEVRLAEFARRLDENGARRDRLTDAAAPAAVAALRPHQAILAEVGRQLERLRAGVPWGDTMLKTLSLLVESTVAAMLPSFARELDIGRMFDVFGGRETAPSDEGVGVSESAGNGAAD